MICKNYHPVWRDLWGEKKNPTKTNSKLKPRMCSDQTVQQEKAFTQYSNDLISFINLSA